MKEVHFDRETFHWEMSRKTANLEKLLFSRTFFFLHDLKIPINAIMNFLIILLWNVHES